MKFADIYFSVADIEEIVDEDLRALCDDLSDPDEVKRFAIDATLDYVIEWMKERGDTGLANELHLLVYEE